MRTSGNKGRFKLHNLQIINKSALIRLAVLFVIVLISGIWLWWTMFWMPEKSYQGQLPPLNTAEITLQKLLQQDLQKLAGDIGIRNYSQYEKLNTAKDFLTTALTQAGYEVKQQEYQINGKSYYNIAVEKQGTKKPDEIIVVGGHYDSAFTSPGANDNATGAIATLELAKIFANKTTNRTIRFVEFTNEEPPFFWTENMGSLVYAKKLHQSGDKVVAMLSLETMGYFSEQPGSQQYPFPIGLLYPNHGNFISFIGNINSGDLVKKAISSFRRHVQFPSQGTALPSWIPGVGWSDQWSFWQQDYKGIMVTDTAPYRYQYYHTDADTLDKVDIEKLARVVNGLVTVISDLAT
ncbi:M28 family peptidase [Sphaerospermopsis aphanizomenoides BCCUSP55]|uniref:M28 family peptidase n=1 Tax=Sphaerospermopsis aphanizomenoides TaxID=459663 RepID=UPI001908FD3A|nr:M28 family peptidase [Sphaerospermopsis aphanizomenoides]MBK1989634.1 M28 family peptidase [Sphaerospermopsis aphanizomenoides BCCUSP55]